MHSYPPQSACIEVDCGGKLTNFHLNPLQHTCIKMNTNASGQSLMWVARFLCVVPVLKEGMKKLCASSVSRAYFIYIRLVHISSHQESKIVIKHIDKFRKKY